MDAAEEAVYFARCAQLECMLAERVARVEREKLEREGLVAPLPAFLRKQAE